MWHAVYTLVYAKIAGVQLIVGRRCVACVQLRDGVRSNCLQIAAADARIRTDSGNEVAVSNAYRQEAVWGSIVSN
jgi:hypothetical protein